MIAKILQMKANYTCSGRNRTEEPNKVGITTQYFTLSLHLVSLLTTFYISLFKDTSIYQPSHTSTCMQIGPCSPYIIFHAQ